MSRYNSTPDWVEKLIIIILFIGMIWMLLTTN